jgi:hypothetical protein
MNVINDNLVNNDNDYDMIVLNVSDWKNNYLNSKSVRCKDRFQTLNHPLVTLGEAFWIDNNNLCIGYKLKNNSDIFNIRKEAQNNIIKKDINFFINNKKNN